MQVCPTGIDIRNGLQYECIGCAACIDGCNQVMDKMGYPRGLIRYSTEHALQRNLSRAQMFRRVLRPRSLIYLAILAGIVVAAGVSLALRVPLKVDVIRDRAAIAREVGDGEIENVYRLQIINTTEKPQRYEIGVEGLKEIHIAGPTEVEVGPASSRELPFKVRVHAEREHLAPGTHRIEFKVRALGDESVKVEEKSVFIVR